MALELYVFVDRYGTNKGWKLDEAIAAAKADPDLKDVQMYNRLKEEHLDRAIEAYNQEKSDRQTSQADTWESY
ncbi:hypothetical protein SPOG_00903 [Schizosaccharomyces cryophilus OY26]|uniref:Uncharacterized protein n=1 Tax=Schizosaccharomyces cryophilus (strain OY26 / ATCC MYA-4695 / CBS 11777 / NBRC 106824 / NRRL Y48691) TaxID=653667 RepID=S9WZJ2_SCHCR|nr:uncharacterized protein SPOG_00903 [Schizosaccharomyces cryophilus OY26]EPY50142.1 hypothetical protein SPOG_00903 [Schizosaccharomyces cryophilus OY26]